jgi:hypothetical protein
MCRQHREAVKTVPRADCRGETTVSSSLTCFTLVISEHSVCLQGTRCHAQGADLERVGVVERRARAGRIEEWNLPARAASLAGQSGAGHRIWHQPMVRARPRRRPSRWVRADALREAEAGLHNTGGRREDPTVGGYRSGSFSSGCVCTGERRSDDPRQLSAHVETAHLLHLRLVGAARRFPRDHRPYPVAIAISDCRLCSLVGRVEATLMPVVSPSCH